MYLCRLKQKDVSILCRYQAHIHIYLIISHAQTPKYNIIYISLSSPLSTAPVWSDLLPANFSTAVHSGDCSFFTRLQSYSHFTLECFASNHFLMTFKGFGSQAYIILRNEKLLCKEEGL